MVVSLGDSRASFLNFILYLIILSIHFVGLVANSIFILTFLCHLNKLKNTSILYIFNLSLVQELFMIRLGPFIFRRFFDDWEGNDLRCEFIYICENVYNLASAMLVLALVADRFFYMRSRFVFKLNTPKFAAVICLCIWAISTFTAFLFLVLANWMYEENAHHILCTLNFSPFPSTTSLDYSDLRFTLYPFLIAFAIPILPIIIFFSMTKFSRSSDDVLAGAEAINLASLPTEPGENEDGIQISNDLDINSGVKERIPFSQDDKLNRLIAAVVWTHFICWIPYWATYFVHQKEVSDDWRCVTAFTFALRQLNVLIDPFIYLRFREVFKSQ